MPHPKLLYLFSPQAPLGSQLFSLGDGSDGIFNPGADTTIDGVKQYTSFNIASGITVTQTANTGILVIQVQSDVTIAGALNLNGKGYASNGDPAVIGARRWGSGIGRGYNNSGGSAYGNEDLLPLYLGSSGGSGVSVSGETASAGAGGAGGGAVILIAKKITVTGSITANGNAGANDADSGGGGGGSGGSVLLVAQEMSIGTNLVTALGGAGGNPGAGKGDRAGGGAGYGAAGETVTTANAKEGGAGAVGRIRLDYKSLGGSTNPAAHAHSEVILGYLKQFAASAGLGL